MKLKLFNETLEAVGEYVAKDQAANAKLHQKCENPRSKIHMDWKAKQNNKKSYPSFLEDKRL